MAVGEISGASDPYAQTAYQPGTTDKNTLTITSYFKLLAAQLANQDMTNPMDNSEMMAQMTQMAMVQSLTAMTESIQTSTAVSTQTYAAGLVGQEITVAVTETEGDGDNETQKPVNVKYGKVEKVSFVGGSPYIYLEGDKKAYPLTYVLGMGKIDNPYEEKKEEEDSEGEGDSGDPDAGSKTTGVSNGPENSSNPLYDPSLFI